MQSINYDKDIENIILITDISLTEWETVLMQINKEIKKRHFIHYESNLWLFLKQNYDAEKWKCWDVLKVLKKVHF